MKLKKLEANEKRLFNQNTCAMKFSCFVPMVRQHLMLSASNSTLADSNIKITMNFSLDKIDILNTNI